MSSLTRLAALAAMAALLVSCGDDKDEPLAPDPEGNDLVFTREDQTTIQFPSDSGTLVWCGPWDEDVGTPSLQILFYGPEAEDPSWALGAVIADVVLGQPLSFPNAFDFDDPKDVAIFIVDPPNELSTQDDESSGTITFQELDCGSGGEVQFEIDAVIGSELTDGPHVHVTGTFRATVGEAPTR
jgi:hypothetical protein